MVISRTDDRKNTTRIGVESKQYFAYEERVTRRFQMRRRRRRVLPILVGCMMLMILTTATAFVLFFSRLSGGAWSDQVRSVFSGDFPKQEERRTVTMFTTVLEADVGGGSDPDA